ncbi:hypothetical protein OIU84_017802 [Salix udensis]|uniref:Uncharacterized protein n=1 Tax=Salix udensis TaxID=889485 RepID=A0AAD6PMW4_9ROSI|nr:hypothetical protein OIU84_017802 [Salix udensis]
MPVSNPDPFDFLKPKAIGSRIKQLPKGYDLNYALDGARGLKIWKAAVVQDKNSGIEMELSTNAPGLQFYTGNMIMDVKGKDGAVYKAHTGLCLETQWYKAHAALTGEDDSRDERRGRFGEEKDENN